MATYKNVDEAFNFNTTERRITHESNDLSGQRGHYKD